MEILVGILLVLILLILADGARRMLRDRGSRLKLRIDPAVTRHAGEDVPESNPELVGGARVVKRPHQDSDIPADPELERVSDDAEDVPEVAPKASRPASVPRSRPRPEPERRTQERAEPASRQEPVLTREPVAAPEDHLPPLVMEADEPPMEPVREAEQQDLFGGERAPAQAPADDLPIEVIVVHLVASRDAPFPGRELLQRVLEQGMRYGEMNIFHRHSQGDGPANLQFSMANALEPGYFDVDEMDKQQFRAVTFFMKLPGPLQPLSALERMLTTARKLHDALGGEMRDDQHSVLTPQTIEHLRQKVQDFERRQRLSHAH